MSKNTPKRQRLNQNDPDWEFEEQIDANGSLSNAYYYKGQRAVRIPLTGHLARQAAGYSLIEKDLRNIIWCIKRMLVLMDKVFKGIPEPEAPIKTPGNRDDANLLKLLLVGALSLYGKLFVASKGRGVQLDRKHVDKRFREDHDYLMQLRHSFAAHSGEERHEDVAIVLLLDPDEIRNEACNLSTELKQPDALDRKGMEKFLEIATDLHKDVEKKRGDLLLRIMKTEVMPKGPEYWQLMGKLRGGISPS